MGSAARYRWNEWGYQETVLHLRLGTNPDAQVWINHPGEVLHSGYGRPSYWGGSGTLPRVHQYRDLAVVIFDAAAEQPDFTHAWFPRQVFDASRVDGAIALAKDPQARFAHVEAFTRALRDASVGQLDDAIRAAGWRLYKQGRRARE